MAVMSICIISVIALANRNYMFARLVFVLWPIVLVTSAVRAAVMSKCGRAAGLPLHVDAEHNSRLSAVNSIPAQPPAEQDHLGVQQRRQALARV